MSAWLAERFKTMKAGQVVNGYSDPDGIAFLSEHGRRFDPRNVNKELAEVCVKAKIPVVSPHKLRHTAATLALMETGDLHGVQKMLGHQQVALTSNLYGHATAERLRPITDALGKIVNPKR
jgi:site-specific recombinase XerD